MTLNCHYCSGHGSGGKRERGVSSGVEYEVPSDKVIRGARRVGAAHEDPTCRSLMRVPVVSPGPSPCQYYRDMYRKAIPAHVIVMASSFVQLDETIPGQKSKNVGGHAVPPVFRLDLVQSPVCPRDLAALCRDDILPIPDTYTDDGIRVGESLKRAAERFGFFYFSETDDSVIKGFDVFQDLLKTARSSRVGCDTNPSSTLTHNDACHRG